MVLDVKGGIKNTKISSNPYVVVEELLSNAIDSYLIRRHSNQNCPSFEASISIEFRSNELLPDTPPEMAITFKDNGAGFGDREVKAFVTKDTTFKDSLSIPGIGKCKGAGRIQLFHYYNKIEIESVFIRNDRKYRRKLVAENAREISEDHFIELEETSMDVHTTFSLSSPNKSSAALLSHADDSTNFSAIAVKNHVYISFLQRLIILRGIIGDFTISISEKRGDALNEEAIRSSELPSPIEQKKLLLACTHSKGIKSEMPINVTTYALPDDKFKQVKHEVALCANSAVVLNVTKHFIKSNADINAANEGRIFLILADSPLLEEKVNEQRDNFDIPKDCSLGDDYFSEYSLQDILDSLEDYVYSILTPVDFDKEALINETQTKFGISRHMLEQASIKVHFGDTEENIAKRVLKKYQEDIVKETAEIFGLKDELSKLDPRSDDFRKKVNEIAWKHTSSIKRVDMANLSQLVVRRSCMLEILKQAVSRVLACQQELRPGARNDNERIIHNIFFPTGKDSSDAVDHDIWILNEEYHYFNHIASDKPLASIPWNGTDKLFPPDIDASLEKMFLKNNESHGQKRPDIAIYNEEGAAIIIEFKAPGVALQDHVQDLVEYSRLLASKSMGRITRFFCYLIGDTIDENRLTAGFKQFPSGTGYFETAPLLDLKTRIPLGDIYSEILLYSQFVSKAENRLSAYKRKLNLGL